MRLSTTNVIYPAISFRKQCGICAACEVRGLAICAALDNEDIVRLEQVMTVRQLDANEALIEQGAPRLRVYSLTAGMLRLYSDLPDGRRQITGFLLPGDYLGLADDEVHSQSAQAVVPSTLCGFAVRDMDRLIAEFPGLKDRLHDMTRLALQQARASQMVLGRLSPVEKVASFLVMLSHRVGQHDVVQEGDAVRLLLPMSRTDIADYLGLTIETVSRCFTKLRAQGLIRLPETHLVEIADWRALSQLAGVEAPA